MNLFFHANIQQIHACITIAQNINSKQLNYNPKKQIMNNSLLFSKFRIQTNFTHLFSSENKTIIIMKKLCNTTITITTKTTNRQQVFFIHKFTDVCWKLIFDMNFAKKVYSKKKKHIKCTLLIKYDWSMPLVKYSNKTCPWTLAKGIQRSVIHNFW